MLRVWCRGWVIEGGKMYMIRIDFATVFFFFFLLSSLRTQCVTFQIPEKFDIARPTGGKLHIVNGDLVPDSVLTLKKKLC